MENAVKTCTGCKLEKSICEFYLSRSKPRQECKLCSSKRNAEYHNRNRAKLLAAMKIYRDERSADIAEMCRAWRKRHRSELLPRYRAKNKRQSDGLTDTYIKFTLSHHSKVLTASDIPQALVEVKRAQLMILRELNK